MTQAIVTKFLGPTANKGARIKATCWAGSVTVPFDYSLTGAAPFAVAAKALIEKLKWEGTFVAGTHGDGSYTFVNVTAHDDSSTV